MLSERARDNATGDEKEWIDSWYRACPAVKLHLLPHKNAVRSGAKAKEWSGVSFTTDRVIGTCSWLDGVTSSLAMESHFPSAIPISVRRLLFRIVVRDAPPTDS